MAFHDVVKERAIELSKGDDFAEHISASIKMKEIRYLVITLYDLLDILKVKDYSQQFFVQAKFGSNIMKTEPFKLVETNKIDGKNKRMKTKQGQILQQMWFAVSYPSMVQDITVSVWEIKDLGHHSIIKSRHKCYATCDNIDFSDIRSNEKKYFHFALPFYGGPCLLKSQKKLLTKLDKDAIEDMNLNNNSSHFRGTLILTLQNLPSKSRSDSIGRHESFVKKYEPSEDKHDGIDMNYTELESKHTQMDITLPPRLLQTSTTRNFSLKTQILMGSNLPVLPSFMSSQGVASYGVRVSCGSYYIDTNMISPDKSFTCDWGSGGSLVQTLNFSIIGFQCPDIIITLLSGSKPVPISFKRMRALDLLNQSSGTNTEGKKIRIEPDAQWIHLKEEKGVDLLPYNVFPGSILLKLGLYNDNDVSRQNNTSDQDVNDLSCAWENESNLATATPVDQCTVTVNMHIYSGRDLPPADQKTGALDSYLKCTLGGETKQTSVRYNSCNPTFFETLSFNLDVPRQRDLWPEIIVQIWDHDKGSMDDFIGNIVLSLSDAIGATKSSDKSVDGEEHGEDFHKSRPEWRKIFFQEPGDIKQGSFLISLEVLYDEDFLNLISPLSLSSNCEDTIFPFTQPLTGDKSKALTTNSFLPLGSEKKVEILVLGCHDLSSPSSFADLSSPFLSLKIGESTTAETFSSKKPSAENCNYNQKIIFDNVYLPDDAEFAPRLQITVFDKGGIFSMVSKGRTILGTGSCSLANTEFYKKMHEKSTKESFDDFPVMLNNTIPQEKGYRSNRTKTKEELEIEPIYETVGIFRGKRSKGPEPSSKYELQRVGKVNLLIRIFDDEFDTGEDLSRWDILLQEFLTPKRYNVRVYILKAIDLTPQDKNNKSDPFCKLRLTGGGKKTSWVKSQTKKKTLSPEFFERFDLSCKIPGKPTLEIKVLDEDKYSDDLIGLTTIQLDHRIFSKKWNSYGTKKPIERRFLKHPSSVHPQGSLKMWVVSIFKNDFFSQFNLNICHFTYLGHH
uniref:C2 domain-containing protein n=1 Tax=Corethron hystrix TaxID=216773 RepID=A0A7S1B6S0_9STRA